MSNIIDLSKYIAKEKSKQEDLEIENLWLSVDKVMKEIGEIDLEVYNVKNPVFENLPKSKSDSALFEAYYALMEEKREDLAELVLEIIRMK